MTKYIQFRLGPGSNENASARAASRAFPITILRALEFVRDNAGTGTYVKTTPAAFGLFIAYRVEEGMTNNRIAILEVKVLDEPETPLIVDLRK